MVLEEQACRLWNENSERRTRGGPEPSRQVPRVLSIALFVHRGRIGEGLGGAVFFYLRPVAAGCILDSLRECLHWREPLASIAFLHAREGSVPQAHAQRACKRALKGLGYRSR